MKLKSFSRKVGKPYSPLFYILTLGSLSVAIFCGHWFFSRSQSAIPPQLSQLPQDESIRVYFNHNQAVEFTEPYRSKTRRGDDLGAKIVGAIDSAQSSIDVAVQELKLPHIAQALTTKALAGVKVRVIVENNYSRPPSDLTAAEVAALATREQERHQEFQKLVDIDRNGTLSQAEIAQRDALIILRDGKVSLLDDTADGSKGSGLMHHKFMVVDGSKVIVTSANWTMSDIYGDISQPDSEGNQNNLVEIESRELAQVFTNEFNLMWGDGTQGNPSSQFKARKPLRAPVEVVVGKTRLSVKFSPSSRQADWENSSNGLIGKFLNTSQQQIDMALFVFSEPTLGTILQAQSQQGIKVRGLIDRQFAYRNYSSALPLMGVDGNNPCQAPTNTVPGFQPLSTIGVPTLPTGDLLHHKFAVIDRRTVITGSHNWSNAANERNDETVLIIQDNPIIAAHFDREFDRLYQPAALGIPARFDRKSCN